MSFVTGGGFRKNPEFVLIGDPVVHSLSPAMHNALYEELGKTVWPCASWEYHALQCPDEASALYQIDLVRTGKYRGMNITTPYKQLALNQADLADVSADVAGGANVLVRNDIFQLCAYNTDGRGAIGAIERASGASIAGKHVVICGTGPTSKAIAAAAEQSRAARVTILSRDASRAVSSVNRIKGSLPLDTPCILDGLSYAQADTVISAADIIVDATLCGMHPDDGSVIDPCLLHEGQLILDTVYGHGMTKLVEGARAQGALAFDGLEMLVEQAALSVEIWAHELALDIDVDRDLMRRVALHHGQQAV